MVLCKAKTGHNFSLESFSSIPIFCIGVIRILVLDGTLIPHCLAIHTASLPIAEILNLSEVTLNGIGAEARKNVIMKFNVEKMCFSTYSEYKKLFN